MMERRNPADLLKALANRELDVDDLTEDEVLGVLAFEYIREYAGAKRGDEDTPYVIGRIFLN